MASIESEGSYDRNVNMKIESSMAISNMDLAMDVKAGLVAQQIRQPETLPTPMLSSQMSLNNGPTAKPTCATTSSSNSQQPRTRPRTTSRPNSNAVDLFHDHGLTDEDVQHMPYVQLMNVMKKKNLSPRLQDEIKVHRKRLQNRKHVKKYCKKQKHSSLQMQAVTGALEQELISLRQALQVANLQNSLL